MADLEHFFGALNANLDAAAESNRRQLQQFVNELAPRLEAARTLERELDRRLARRFNALSYLRNDELGLSRIIADLLNPKGVHGQGDTFLRLFLDRLAPVPKDLPGEATVAVELEIHNQRRLDIAVRFGKEYCLAIENKPYARDQQDQIRDYLRWLKRTYRSKFLLIYLSPQGQPPSELSVVPEDDGGENLHVMPYHEAAPGGFGLTAWLRACRMHCDVERLRWFLAEAEAFCEREFGGNTMTASEIGVIKEFVLSDHRNVTTAAAIQGAWPDICSEICSGFFEHLKRHLEEEVQRRVERDKGGRYWLRVSDAPGESHYVGLRHDAKGPKGWWFHVSINESKKDEHTKTQMQRKLEKKLGKSAGAGPYEAIVWSEYCEHRDWTVLIPKIYRELSDGAGEITECYASRLKEVMKAVREIDNHEP